MYQNNDKDWQWLSEKCGKAARWLGGIPFDMIIDNRDKSIPEVRPYRDEVREPWPYIHTEIYSGIPAIPEIGEIAEVEEITKHVGVVDFQAAQPFKLVMIGEKSDLDGAWCPL